MNVPPEFVGGMDKFDAYVKANFKNAKAKKGARISATFIIEMDGSVSNVVITKDDKFGSGDELKRVLEMSPKWLQGEHEGYHVRTKLDYVFTI